MKILLAEDDFISSEIIKEHLQQWGYEVICASRGSHAWDILQADDAPKLAILDWQMPDVTGLEICKRLRRRTRGSYVYVIMLTALTEKAYVLQGLEAGADDYLSKPCNPQELRLRLIAGKRILALEAELLATLNQMRHHAGVHSSDVYDKQLTGRELDILKLIVSGKNNEAICLNCQLSPDLTEFRLGVFKLSV